MTNPFTLSRIDFVLFQKQAAKLVSKAVPRARSLMVKAAVWFFIGLAVSVYARLYASATAYRSLVALVGVLVVFAVVAFFVAQTALARLSWRHYLRDGGPLLSPQTISLDVEGLTSVTLQGLGSSRYAWAAFIGRTEDDRNIYLLFEPTYGIIVPKAALAESDKELIRAKLRQL